MVIYWLVKSTQVFQNSSNSNSVALGRPITELHIYHKNNTFTKMNELKNIIQAKKKNTTCAAAKAIKERWQWIMSYVNE